MFQGLRVGPYASGSVTGRLPNSGLFVRPSVTSPAARNRETSVLSAGEIGIASRRATLPFVIGCPAYGAHRSFNRNGTPRNGPSERSAPEATSRAWSNHRMMTALIGPSSCSIRSIAASVSSSGEASPLATSSAWAVASIQRVSSASDPIDRFYQAGRDRFGP